MASIEELTTQSRDAILRGILDPGRSCTADVFVARTCLETSLAKLYADGCEVQVAKLCDEDLDKSGALLGRIRAAARALKAN